MDAVEDLTREEADALKELHRVRDAGESVPVFVDRRLNEELSDPLEVDEWGQIVERRKPGYVEQRQIYDGLAAKGMLDFDEGLTSAGRCYFARLEDERREKRSAGRHDYLVALVGGVSGAVAGFFAGLYSDQIAGAFDAAFTALRAFFL